MTKFVVDLGNAHLSDEHKKAISSAIHAAVLPHIAALSHTGGAKLMALSLVSGVCVGATTAEIATAHDHLVATASS